MMNNYPEVIFVTGAGRGIGKAVSLALSKEDVTVVCISKNNALKTCVEINKLNKKGIGITLDISDYEHAEYKIREFISFNEMFGYNADVRVGIVLAAGTLGDGGGLLDSNLSNWDYVIRTNLLGNLAILKGVLPKMLKAKFGRIVFLAGGGSAYKYEKFSAYASSKVAIVREVENLASELKDMGDFSCVALAPGAIETDMLRQVREAGGEIKTTGDIQEPVEFIKYFMQSTSNHISGRFVHSRDDWKEFMDNPLDIDDETKWLLRRLQ
jgi:3-oxoacyl-[acyl-carrier protein] reductase